MVKKVLEANGLYGKFADPSEKWRAVLDMNANFGKVPIREANGTTTIERAAEVFGLPSEEMMKPKKEAKKDRVLVQALVEPEIKAWLETEAEKRELGVGTYLRVLLRFVKDTKGADKFMVTR